MVSKKDIEIIAHLRRDGRKKITDIAKDTGIPVTTIYDRVRSHKKRFVKKHTALLDFEMLGLLSKAHLAIKADRDSRLELQMFMQDTPNVNSLYRVNLGYDYIAETVFRNMAELHNFAEQLERDFKCRVEVFNVVEELKREDFLTEPGHLDM
ncbi:MAG: Lrp/AsnC family transcriptional regulator [archaeon]